MVDFIILKSEVYTMKETPVIRIQRAKIRNFRNVVSGEIRFPCSFGKDVFAPKADVLGIYGQNGSGKTTFIDVLEILKGLLCGEKIDTELSDCISYGHDNAQLQFEFSIFNRLESGKICKRRLIYEAILSRDSIDETVKCITFDESSKKNTRLKTIFECRHQDKDDVFSPRNKLEMLFGTRKNNKINDLTVFKMLCGKEHRSFIFSREFLSLLRVVSNKADDDIEPLFEISYYAKTSLFVILNRNNGLISLDAAIPFNFRTENAGGFFALPIDSPVTVSSQLLDIADQVLNTINTVLCKMIPGVKLGIKKIGTELMNDGNVGTKIQMVRKLECEDGEVHDLPLKYESEGIKKITSVLHLLIAVYNSPSITLAIDELDSGIYEYLLGELLRIMQDSGKGQLIFTSHNLYPLETLHSESLIFTTTDENARYSRIKNVRATNNLRSMYLREIILGSEDDVTLYEETNTAEIAHAMRLVGRDIKQLTVDDTEGGSNV